MSDIVERLRSLRGSFVIPVEGPPLFVIVDEAADRIEQDAVEIGQLREALQLYVDRCPMCTTGVECQDDLCYGYQLLLLGQAYDAAVEVRRPDEKGQ